MTKIYIKDSHHVRCFNIHNDFSLLSLKTKIYEYFGYDERDYWLGRDRCIVRDDYHSPQDCSLRLNLIFRCLGGSPILSLKVKDLEGQIVELSANLEEDAYQLLSSSCINYQISTIRLFNDGQELENNVPLSSYNIVQHSVIEMRVKVSIIKPDRVETDVCIVLQQTFAVIKRILFSLLDIPVEQQRLRCNGRHVEDYKTFSDVYDAVNMPKIEMAMKVHCEFNNENDKNHYFVFADESVKNLKKMIKPNNWNIVKLSFNGKELRNETFESAGVHDGSMVYRLLQVLIKPFFVQKLAIYAAHYMKVGDLIKQLQNMVTIPIEDVHLFKKNMLLEAHKCLADYNVNYGTTLIIKFKIYVKIKRKIDEIYVEPSDKLVDITNQIVSNYDMNKDTLILEYSGSVLDINKTIQDCSIDPNSTIILRQCFTIKIIDLDSVEKEISVYSNLKIEELKNRVRHFTKIHHPFDQPLCINKQLLGNDTTLKDYNIQEGCTIVCGGSLTGHYGASINSCTAEIKTKYYSTASGFINISICYKEDVPEKPYEHYFNFLVSWSSKITDVKKKIKKKIGIPVFMQRLYFNGYALRDDFDITMCGVKNDDVLELEAMMTIFILHKTEGRSFAMEVFSSDSVNDLEGNIKKIINWNEWMQLFFNSQPLMPEVKLNEARIKPNNVIHLMNHTMNHAEIRDFTNFNVNKNINIHHMNNFTDDTDVFSINISLASTIEDIKKIIHEKLGHPLSMMRLYYKKRILVDGFPLQMCNLTNNDNLHLELSIPIFIDNTTGDFKSFPLEVFLSDSVYSLCNKINDEIGIELDDQRLVFNSRQLSPEKKLKMYKIKDHDTIQLVRRMRGD
eukprot:GHVL01009404.1.p1 GENE.GHVL01009404.1~~GHVL01009404.1.p1  ORF type:complete len:846 (+),score=134.41 GHVL01009404.1:361-2898(+)